MSKKNNPPTIPHHLQHVVNQETLTFDKYVFVKISTIDNIVSFCGKCDLMTIILKIEKSYFYFGVYETPESIIPIRISRTYCFGSNSFGRKVLSHFVAEI